jgi:nucleoid-associated protein YgaU
MTSAQLSEGPAGRATVTPIRPRRAVAPGVVGGSRGCGPQPVAPGVARRGAVRPGRRPARGEGVAVVRPVRGGCTGRTAPGDPGAGWAEGARHPVPPLRLTRRGRRLVAALSIAIGVGIAVVAAAAVADGGSGALRLAGDSSVVVQSGDTLWSIAVSVAPEEDTRAVVDAIVEVNDLAGTGLVPDQVLQLP